MISVLVVNEVTARTGTVDGVDDYSARLCEALRAQGVNAQHQRFEPWDFRSLLEARRTVRSGRFDLTHVQVSSFNSSPTLELFALAQRSVITVHEWTNVRTHVRLKWLAAFLRPRAVIFTNDHDRRAVKRCPRLSGRPSATIPIGSNIDVSEPVSREPSCVVSFGAIRPDRGWEAFIESAGVARERGLDWSFRAIGGAQIYLRRYQNGLRKSSAAKNVTFSGQLDEASVARELARATVGLFPYPDGASERRGSLLAAMTNGLPVVTTDGPQLSTELRRCVAVCTSPADAVRVIQRLMKDDSERRRMEVAGRAYVANRSLERIAKAHCDLYESTLRRG